MMDIMLTFMDITMDIMYAIHIIMDIMFALQKYVILSSLSVFMFCVHF